MVGTDVWGGGLEVVKGNEPASILPPGLLTSLPSLVGFS